MSYADQAVLASDGNFGLRVRVALCEEARNVMAETAGKGTAVNINDEKRSALAWQILSDGGISKELSFCFAIASVPKMDNVNDNVLIVAIRAVWNSIAGIKG